MSGRAPAGGPSYAAVPVAALRGGTVSTGRTALAIWRRLAATAGGRWLFARLVCLRAPYFATIRPAIVELRSGRCEVRIRKRRAVQNHLGTVHAIAMCNAAELAAGLVSEATVPATHRWIPKGMTVEYLRKAETDLRVVAELDLLPALGTKAEVPVYVNILDASGEAVCRATIRMWVSARR